MGQGHRVTILMDNDTEFLSENIGYTVRLWRLASGYGIEEFSRQTGIPVDTITMIETSQASLSLDQAFRMAAVFDMNPSDLMASIGKPSMEARIRLLALTVASHPDPEVRRYVEKLINTALEADDGKKAAPKKGPRPKTPKKT